MSEVLELALGATMKILEDRATRQLSEFLNREAESVGKSVLLRYVPPRFFSSSIINPFLDSLNQPLAPIREGLELLESDIATVCRRHDRSRLLLLFRKIPIVLLQQLSESLLQAKSKIFAVSGLVHDSILFGTNAILLYSSASSLGSYNERYKLIPLDQDFRDSYELAVLCLLHRMFMYQHNTLARRELAEPVSFIPLIDIYNVRLVNRGRRVEADDLPGIVFPGSFAQPRMELFSIRREGGAEYGIILRNFLPTLIDPDSERERYSYLAGEKFFGETGLAFESAWEIWVALNQVLAESMIFFWDQPHIDQAEEDEILPAIERADDFTETCLGGGRRSSLIQATSRCLERWGEWDAAQDCHKFVEYLTFRSMSGDVRSIEQPFLFYPLGEDLLLWDYLRHGGFMKAIARIISAGSGLVGGSSGKSFEDYIERRVRELPAAEGVKRNRKIFRGGLEVWEIDLGFVVSGILVVVEAKHYVKPWRYHFADDVEVSSRVTKFEDLLDVLDRKLLSCKEDVLSFWATEKPVGAVCVVCTVEVEFIASFNPTLWLDVGRLPRVLTPYELIDWLRDGSISVKDHPSFVSFE